MSDEVEEVETEETEGHRQVKALEDAGETEGHVRLNLDEADEDETEGHIRMLLDEADEDDTEGHRQTKF